MKRFFASTLFLLSSVSAFAALPNGIYLVADSASEKFYSDRRTMNATDAYGKLVRVKDLPGPAFGDTDLGSLVYDYRMFYKNSKPYVPYAFTFTPRERGRRRMEELAGQKAPFMFVFIIDGVSVASGKLFQANTYSTDLALEAFCSYETIKTSVAAWNRQLRAGSDWVSDTTYCGEKLLRFISGLPARQELYWNGELIQLREWYPDGKLMHSMDFTISGGHPHYCYEREYDKDGMLISNVYSINGKPYVYRYARWYSPAGMLIYVDSSYTEGGKYYSVEHGYDTAGALSYSLRKSYLEPLPEYGPGENGIGSETNWPHVIEQLTYENGKLVSTMQFYSRCDICDSYDTGTWKFYKNGKLSDTKTYEDWKALDAKFRREALAELQKRQKKKKK